MNFMSFYFLSHFIDGRILADSVFFVLQCRWHFRGDNLALFPIIGNFIIQLADYMLEVPLSATAPSTVRTIILGFKFGLIPCCHANISCDVTGISRAPLTKQYQSFNIF